MAVYLVTYDLHVLGQNYQDLLTKIKKYNWIQLSESSYAIQSSTDPVTLYNNLSTSLDRNDHIYIITLGKPFWGFGPQQTNDWLSSHLT